MPLAQHSSSAASLLVKPFVLLAFVVTQCAADANDNSSVSGAAIDFTVIVIAVFAFLLALVLWYRWLLVRRRARAASTAMTQSRAVLPTIQPTFSGDNARPLPSQQSYLGENIANQPTAMRLEPPPAYHGKQLAEGEMVIPTDSQPPPSEAETPPAYTTPTMALLPPAYMPNINARQAIGVP